MKLWLCPHFLTHTNTYTNTDVYSLWLHKILPHIDASKPSTVLFLLQKFVTLSHLWALHFSLRGMLQWYPHYELPLQRRFSPQNHEYALKHSLYLYKTPFLFRKSQIIFMVYKKIQQRERENKFWEASHSFREWNAELLDVSIQFGGIVTWRVKLLRYE